MRRLVQPLTQREKIPWKKTTTTDDVCPLDFKPTNTGIQVPIPDDFDELAAASLFLPDNLWVLIATESNRYYKQKQKDKAVAPDITPAEARCYAGIMILLCLNPLHDITTPWKRDSSFRIDLIASTMAYHRSDLSHGSLPSRVRAASSHSFILYIRRSFMWLFVLLFY